MYVMLPVDPVVDASIRRRREVDDQAPFSWLSSFGNHPEGTNVALDVVHGGLLPCGTIVTPAADLSQDAPWPMTCFL